MSPLPSPQTDIAAVQKTPDVEYARSAEGLLVARIGDLVFAMVPGPDGHFLASGWRVTRPLDQTKRDDFYSHYGAVADEAAFRTRMAEQAEHSCELKGLSRQVTRIACSTPWGASQGATVYADGVVSHHTASHGGFKLSAERNRLVHPLMRVNGGFYEEDCAWAIVAITFPHLFTSYERRCAEKTLKDGWPDAWEAIFGTILTSGESYEKDRRAFNAEHVGDWIVISAITSDHEKGFVECVATPGGKRALDIEERRFLVPSSEYKVGRFGFVIDPACHRLYDGPSDFIGPAPARPSA